MPIILFGLGNGFSVANCIIGGVSSTGNQSGTATGIAGALQMSSGGIIGAIVITLGGDENFLTCLLKGMSEDYALQSIPQKIKI